ncbi:MAG TPA: Fic family protein [Stellaceae bacterium]|nr:Fic family protein [Stellaceae bacterium]
MAGDGEPRWVSVEAVVALNREEVAQTGEPHELRDRAALEIAVRRPWNVWVYFMDRDFATLAMSLLVALAGAKAFAAGNERTAYHAAVALLAANGFAVDLGGAREQAEARLFEYFRGRLSQAGVAEWFRTWIHPAGRHE